MGPTISNAQAQMRVVYVTEGNLHAPSSRIPQQGCRHDHQTQNLAPRVNRNLAVGGKLHQLNTGDMQWPHPAYMQKSF